MFVPILVKVNGLCNVRMSVFVSVIMSTPGAVHMTRFMMGMALSMVMVVSAIMGVMVCRHVLAGIARNRGHQFGDIRLQRLKPAVWFARDFVHVKLPIDLDLQRVTLVGRIGICAHKFDALVGIVDANVIAH